MSNFAPYELALKLKEIGFNEPCLANYNNLTGTTRLLIGKTDEGCITFNRTPDKYNAIISSNERILAPLWDQIFEWFRNEHKLHSVFNIYNDFTFDYGVCNLEGLYSTKIASQTNFKTYEEARLKCLEKLIEICTKK